MKSKLAIAAMVSATLLITAAVGLTPAYADKIINSNSGNTGGGGGTNSATGGSGTGGSASTGPVSANTGPVTANPTITVNNGK
jgi:hypothetical protein